MCGKKLKQVWQLLAAFLLLSAYSLPVFSQAVSSPEPDSVQEFLAAAQEIALKHPDMKPQLSKMSDALQKISDKSASKIDQQQKIIDRQAKTLTESDKTIASLRQSQKDYEGSVTAERLNLKNEVSTAQTSATIGWTLAATGWALDILQIVLHGIKLW